MVSERGGHGERLAGRLRFQLGPASMSALLESLGREAEGSRELYLLEALDPHAVPAEIEVAGPLFVCLLAWDAEDASPETIEILARRLLAAGCVYICCWGRGCSKVHDVFDLVSIERGDEAPVVMSTWHERESLGDAIWFALFVAEPDGSFSQRCGSVLGVSIASPEYARQIRVAMAAPAALKANSIMGD